MSLEALMRPKSVAVIGASEDLATLGGHIVMYLLDFGYQGRIFPVNPKYDAIAGLKCYPTVLDVPEEVDCALLMVASKNVFEVLDHLAQRQVKSAIVFSSGFGESGPEGRERQARLHQFAATTGIRICGPNCAGIFNVNDRTPLTFQHGLEMGYLPGNIGFVSQSGALQGALINRAYDRGVGFSFIISSGNEADLEMSDYVEFLLGDRGTDVILLLVEGFRNPEKFVRVADMAIEARKPLIVLKTGQSERGRKSALAHTAAIAGSEEVCDALFKQKGIIRVGDFDELIQTGALFARYPGGIDNGLIITSGSGGAGTFSADICADLGLTLPELSSDTKQKLGEILPAFVYEASNPLDMTAHQTNDHTIFPRCLQLFLDDPAYNVYLNVLVGPPRHTTSSLAGHLLEAAAGTTKVVTMAVVCGSLAGPAADEYRQSRFPYFDSPVTALKAISHLVRYKEFLRRHHSIRKDGTSLGPLSTSTARQAKAILESAGGVALSEYDSKRLLSLYGVPTAREGLARSEGEAVEAARSIGYPVAAKICSSDITHKTEAGGVKLGIRDDDSLIAAYREILENARSHNPAAVVDGVLIQEMIPAGVETIVGVTRDPQFGPAVLFGLGGIFTEVLRDTSLRLAPLSRTDAEEMVREIKGLPLLEGSRGRPKADVGALVEVLLSVSRLIVDLEDSVQALDINPLIVLPQGMGARAADALIVRSEEGPGA